MAKVDYPAILAEAWAQHLAPRETNAPTVISTFAGCGGSSLGYSMAGYRELLAVEWDDNAVETFRLNFPEVSIYHDDICKLSVEECLRLAGIGVGKLDILDGSPPCQGFSTAGKRQIDDPRNSLFHEYVRLLRGLRPRVFVMENVSGLVKGKMKLVFAEIMRELKASGYQVSCRLMNAKYFNVPQSRERLIWVGVRQDVGKEPGHPRAQVAMMSCMKALEPWEEVCQLTYAGGLQGHWHRTHPDVSVSDGLADYRLNPKRPAHTVRKNGSLWHYAQPYPLNGRGYARLASFPDHYAWLGPSSQIQERIGNSVPPLFMRAIARHIREHILSTDSA